MALSGTQPFCGLHVTNSQLTDIKVLQANGETDQKIADLITAGDGLLEACAASVKEQPSTQKAALPSASSNLKAIKSTPKKKLLLDQLFTHLLKTQKRDDAFKEIKDLLSKGGHEDGTLETLVQSISGTQLFCGLHVTNSQLTDIKVLQANGETDQKIADLITAGDGMLEACAASVKEQPSTQKAALPSASSNLKAIKSTPKINLLLDQLFAHLLKTQKRDDAFKEVKDLLSKGGHEDGTLETLVQSIKENGPVAIREAILASRTETGGLLNVGNTCWFNSIVQSFFKHNSPYLTALLNQSKNPENLNNANRSAKLLQIISLSDREVSFPLNDKLYDLIETFITDLYEKKGGSLTRLGAQEDADNGFRALIDYLGLDDAVSKLSPIKFAQSLKGLKTGQVSLKSVSEPVLVLKQGTEASNSIQKLINLFTNSSQVLTGENGSYFNGKQGEEEDTLKTDYLTLATGPPKAGTSFTLQVPRFVSGVDAAGEHVSLKDTRKIDFNPKIAFPVYSENGAQVQGTLKLSLQSVVCHTGNSAQSGHYVTYTRNKDGSYTLYNDSKATQIPETLALKSIQELGYLVTYTVSSFNSRDGLGDVSADNMDYGTDSGLGESSTSSSAASSRDASPSPVDDLSSEQLALFAKKGYSEESLRALEETQKGTFSSWLKGSLSALS